MILVEDRQIIAERIAQAQAKGARPKVAFELAGIDVRTLQRWKCAGLERRDRRPMPFATRPRVLWLARSESESWNWRMSRALRSCHRRESCRCWRMKERTSPANPASIVC
jgi:hypothetical protein